MTDIRLGYACLNTKLREDGVFCSRTVRLSTLDCKSVEEAIKLLKELAWANLKDLRVILEWNARNGIKVFRVSSDIFPFIDHEKYKYDLREFKEELKKLGDYAKSTGQRLTMHPGQFHILNSLKPKVVNDTISSLTVAADTLDLMGLDQDSVLVIHGGSKAGGVAEALALWESRWPLVPPHVQKRIVLENCEMAFSVEDLLPMCERLHIPLVLDYHHHDIHPGKIPLKDNLDRVLQTWRSRGIRPKFHMSQSREGITTSDTLTKRRAHSDLITRLPPLDILPNGIDLMLECKLKEQSIPIVQELVDKITF